MNVSDKDITKKHYFQPLIEQIMVDNEIALVLESLPPTFETNNVNSTTDFFNTNPYITMNT
jgi:hypothetical protein